ncbi:MAG: hypothetical protein NTU47_01775 [Ignavibacteriales bacterium]|nr:hypothetical protein [Ignavibacteriales bacterium]
MNARASVLVTNRQVLGTSTRGCGFCNYSGILKCDLLFTVSAAKTALLMVGKKRWNGMDFCETVLVHHGFGPASVFLQKFRAESVLFGLSFLAMRDRHLDTASRQSGGNNTGAQKKLVLRS